MNLFKTTAIAAGAVVAISGGSWAATCGTSAGLDTTNVQISSIAGEPVPTIDASDCSGVFAENDTGDTGTLLTNLNGGIFSGLEDDWSIFGKSDETDDVTAPETTSGSWSVNFSPEAYSVFAVSLKAATGYAVYLFDLRPDADSLFGGGFETTGILNPGGNVADLSHMTIAVWDGEISVVPLPAAGWLLLGGLGGLAAFKRRKKV